MAEGSVSTGGAGIPIAIDPTINLSSNGAINPIRQLATVRTMSTRELRLVQSEGVVAQYQAEAAEAVDNSPTLVQPVITAQRCTSFVPFSFELGDDWAGLVQELTQLIADATESPTRVREEPDARRSVSRRAGVVSRFSNSASTNRTLSRPRPVMSPMRAPSNASDSCVSR